MRQLCHAIQSLVFDVQIKNTNGENNFLDEVQGFCKNTLVEALDNVFYNNQLADNYLKINRIDIDLGTFYGSDWQERMIKVLEKELLSKLQFDESLIQDKAVQKNDNQLILSNQEYLQTALFFFLQNGYLPWWYSVDKTGSIEKIYIKKCPKSRAKKLLQFINSEPIVLHRFLRVFEEKDIRHCMLIADIVSSNELDNMKIMFDSIFKPLFPVVEEKIYKQQCFKYIIERGNASKKLEGTQLDRMFFELLQSITQIYQIKPKTLQVYQEELSRLHSSGRTPQSEQAVYLFKHLFVDKSNHINQMLDSWENKYLEKTNPVLDDYYKGGIQKTKDFHLVSFTPQDQDDLQEKMEPIQTENKRQSNAFLPIEHEFIKHEENIEEGFYVRYAGITLLHPYLPAFFENLNFTINGNWANQNSTQKAVQVLAFIATGMDYCPEYDQLMFKYLCGLPFNTVVDPHLALSNLEKEEALTLLQNVIFHWQALKNTSVTGLREGFLDRTGKLYKNKGHWYLQIEQKPQDILLQKLPWSMSILRMPWTTELTWIIWN